MISIITIFISKYWIKTGEKGGVSTSLDEDSDELKKIKMLTTQLNEEKTKRKFFEDYLEQFVEGKIPSAPDYDRELIRLKTNVNEKEDKIKKLEQLLEEYQEQTIHNPNIKEMTDQIIKLKTQLNEEKEKKIILEEELQKKPNNNGTYEIIGVSGNEINQMRSELVQKNKNLSQLKEQLDQKNSNLNKLTNQFEESQKQIELLKKIIPKRDLLKTFQYLQLISNIFKQLQALKNKQDNLSKKEKVLSLLNQLSNIDKNTSSDLEKELKELNKNNPEYYQSIIETLDKVIRDIKEEANKMLNEMNKSTYQYKLYNK